MFVALAPAAQAVDVTNVRDFKGSITDVEVHRGPNQIGGVEFRSYGGFVYPGFIDLTKLGPGGPASS